jgi:hypothetical protein
MPTTKEKKEMGLIFGAVLMVAIVGIVLSLKTNETTAFAGQAVTINPELLTESGMVGLLNEKCEPVTGEGQCNSICGSQLCVPVEENCDTSISNNQCLCCTIS